MDFTNFYSHASCEARPVPGMKTPRWQRISTHTPLARRDSSVLDGLKSIFNFYSHASCEARPCRTAESTSDSRFLLTRLLRGATSIGSFASCPSVISTHTPLARRDPTCSIALQTPQHFYSHASCEARLQYEFNKADDIQFLLTRLLRGATATYSIRNSRTSYIQEADSKL